MANMSDAMIKKIYEDVEFLKRKTIDLDLKLEGSRLEFEELSKEDIDFFTKAFEETKGTDFWIPRKK